MNENENITTVVEGEDSFMPDGWHEGMDIFDEGSWPAEGQGDAPAAEAGQQTEKAAGEAAAPATEQTAPGEGNAAKTAPATEQPAQQTNKLRFKARVDRQDLDVEVDESEVPSLYEKAQATDRYKGRLNEVNARMERAEARAKAAGYDNVEAWMDAMGNQMEQAEIRRLVDDGVHEEVAKDMAARKFGVPAQKETAPAEPAKQSAPARDFAAEVAQLRDVYPDVIAKPIPKEVLSATMDAANHKTLLVAYTEYIVGQQKAEADALRKENEVLKQNAAAAARAPVSGVSGGGATDTGPEDDFLRGFGKGW